MDCRVPFISFDKNKDGQVKPTLRPPLILGLQMHLISRCVPETEAKLRFAKLGGALIDYSFESCLGVGCSVTGQTQLVKHDWSNTVLEPEKKPTNQHILVHILSLLACLLA